MLGEPRAYRLAPALHPCALLSAPTPQGGEGKAYSVRPSIPLAIGWGERKANAGSDLGTGGANARRRAKRHRDIGQANAWRKRTGSIPPKGIGSLRRGDGRLAICSTGAGPLFCNNRVANSVQIA